jgi:glycosyltransferase involved in cell wall biosynthesis
MYFKNNILLLTPKIDDGVDLNTLIDAILLIKNNFSGLKVFICGNFVRDEQKKEYLLKIIKNKLENNIIFTGLINSFNDLNKLALNSSIGLTCYRRTKSHTYYEYGDSLKIRKYAYYGLPILSEGFASTAHEARLNKCCFIYNNCKDLAEKIKYLLSNKKKLRELSINALNWHEKNKKILFLQKIILSVK